MSKLETVRVAAVQMATGTDVDANLATCLRMLDRAAKERPALVVLPEFANHLSWYEDKAHCHRVSVPIGGVFLEAIAERARLHRFHVVVNCTVQREGGTATGTSLLYSEEGVLLGTSDKQVLMGHENDFLERATRPSPVVATALGRIGMYACMDGVIAETPRGLALRGAQILANSLNSFALDEASLHVPVRAAENRVFVVAANKVGPLIPEALLDPVSQATSIPKHFLYGAGESQIVAPDGTVLAKAPREGEAVVVAEIRVRDADDKARPDGTSVVGARRPALYRSIGEAPAARVLTPGAPALEVAAYTPTRDGRGAIDDAVAAVVDAARGGAALLVLPELFCFEGGRVQDATEATARSQEALALLAGACARASASDGRACHVVTSLVLRDGGVTRHVGVVIGKDGVVHAQPQLHRSVRHPWATPGDALTLVLLPWGRLAVIVGDDAIYPETFRLAAMAGADVVAVPTHLFEPWEGTLGLLERSAENRVCLVASTRTTAAGGSLIATLWKDFTLMTPWATRAFDGNISLPIVTRAREGEPFTRATVHPAHAADKVVSHRTHLVDGRPWHLSSAITGQELS
jgi:nitrilase